MVGNSSERELKRMPQRTCLAIVLAAGEGTRMRSALPKVLHAIGGRTLLAHVLAAAIAAGGGAIAVVVGPDHDAVARAVRTRRAGRANLRAARAARHRACGAGGASGDRAQAPTTCWSSLPTRRCCGRRRCAVARALARGAAVAVLGFRPRDPAGYGRLVTRGGELWPSARSAMPATTSARSASAMAA